MLVDDNGVSCFVDDNGVTCFVDDNGLTLCCGASGDPFPAQPKGRGKGHQVHSPGHWVYGR